MMLQRMNLYVLNLINSRITLMKCLKTSCEPVIFKSVDDAIDYLHAEFCDLVISDLQIPFRNPTPNGVAVLDTVNQIV